MALWPWIVGGAAAALLFDDDRRPLAAPFIRKQPETLLGVSELAKAQDPSPMVTEDFGAKHQQQNMENIVRDAKAQGTSPVLSLSYVYWPGVRALADWMQHRGLTLRLDKKRESQVWTPGMSEANDYGLLLPVNMWASGLRFDWETPGDFGTNAVRVKATGEKVPLSDFGLMVPKSSTYQLPLSDHAVYVPTLVETGNSIWSAITTLGSDITREVWAGVVQNIYPDAVGSVYLEEDPGSEWVAYTRRWASMDPRPASKPTLLNYEGPGCYIVLRGGFLPPVDVIPSKYLMPIGWAFNQSDPGLTSISESAIFGTRYYGDPDVPASVRNYPAIGWAPYSKSDIPNWRVGFNYKASGQKLAPRVAYPLWFCKRYSDILRKNDVKRRGFYQSATPHYFRMNPWGGGEKMSPRAHWLSFPQGGSHIRYRGDGGLLTHWEGFANESNPPDWLKFRYQGSPWFMKTTKAPKGIWM